MADQNKAAILLEVAEVLASNNWRGDLVEALRDLAATPAVPAVDALTRWHHNEFSQEVHEDPIGEYVKLSDVQALLATPSTAPADPEQAKLDSLAQAGLAAALENRAKGEQPNCAGAVAVEQAMPEVWFPEFEKLLEDYVGAMQETAVFNATQCSGMTVRMAGPRFKKLMAHVQSSATLPVARQPQAASEVIAMLLDVVRAAWHAMDNTEENEHGKVWDAPDFDALSAAMDKLDALPDDRPGYVMGPAAKAEWAMRAIQAAPEAMPAPQTAPVGDFPGYWFDSKDCVPHSHPDYGDGVFFTHDCAKPVAAPEATSEQMSKAESIDTPEFHALADAYHCADQVGLDAAYYALVGYVDDYTYGLTTPRAAEGEATERKPLTVEVVESMMMCDGEGPDESGQWFHVIITNPALQPDGTRRGFPGMNKWDMDVYRTRSKENAEWQANEWCEFLGIRSDK